MMRRKAYQAGRFYPGNAGLLEETIETLMDSATAENISGTIHTGIVPHAGIVYSGLTACHFYKLLKKEYDRIIIIAPSHYFFTDHIVLPQSDIWETPLGDINIDTDAVRMLCDDMIIVNEDMHMEEHAAEVQLPFIRYIFKDSVPVVPVIMGSGSIDAVEHLGNALGRIMDSKTLFIASSDLYHGNNYNEALNTDADTISHILNDDYLLFHDFVSQSHSACGGSCISVVKKISEMNDIHLKQLHHITSSDITGDFTGYTVGYGAFAGIQ